MTPAEKQHKERCEKSLRVAEQAQYEFQRKEQSGHRVMAVRRTGAHPWEVAEKMLEELQRIGNSNSSAWVINQADKVRRLSNLNPLFLMTYKGMERRSKAHEARWGDPWTWGTEGIVRNDWRAYHISSLCTNELMDS
jgi:hypothetical protein